MYSEHSEGLIPPLMLYLYTPLSLFRLFSVYSELIAHDVWISWMRLSGNHSVALFTRSNVELLPTADLPLVSNHFNSTYARNHLPSPLVLSCSTFPFFFPNARTGPRGWMAPVVCSNPSLRSMLGTPAPVLFSLPRL